MRYAKRPERDKKGRAEWHWKRISGWVVLYAVLLTFDADVILDEIVWNNVFLSFWLFTT